MIYSIHNIFAQKLLNIKPQMWYDSKLKYLFLFKTSFSKFKDCNVAVSSYAMNKHCRIKRINVALCYNLLQTKMNKKFLTN